METKTIEQRQMNKKEAIKDKGLSDISDEYNKFFKSGGYNDSLRLIKGSNTNHTSKNNIFWIGFIIGITAGIIFGIVIF